MTDIFKELKYLDHNLQTIFELIEQLTKKTDYMYFLINQEKLKKKAKVWQKEINLYCPNSQDSRSVGILRLSTPFARSVGPTIQKKEQKDEKEN